MVYGFGERWPVVPMLTDGASPGTDDQTAARALVVDSTAHDRALLWIDDELWPDAAEWAQARAAPTKLVVPDATIGLTDADVDEAIVWANSLRTADGHR